MGFELMLKVCKLGNHEDRVSISAHDRMLFEAKARCLICRSLPAGEGGGGIPSILFSERISRSNLHCIKPTGYRFFN